MSYDVVNGPERFVMVENMGLGVGISMLSYSCAEIWGRL